jgi:hypothetical protein
MLSLIGSCGLGATCGWLCAMKTGAALARWRAILAVLIGLALTAGFVHAMLGAGRIVAFLGVALVFWLLHAVWRHNIDPTQAARLQE